MRFCGILAAAVVLAASAASRAVTCTSQAELSAQDRAALAVAGQQLTQAVIGEDLVTLKADLLPAEASAWDTISATVDRAQPLMQGGHAQLRDVYLLDASNQTAPADTEFYCSNASGSLTVTITMRELPPGRYALVLADAAGAPMGGPLGLILAWDSPDDAWKLAGLSVHQGIFDGHDGVWYWERARSLVSEDPWSAWYCYDMARYMVLPVDYLTSPNLDKLREEQTQITPPPPSQLPLSIPDGARTWKIEGVGIDVSLHEPDLDVVYQSTGITDPAAQRTEAIAVLSALLKAKPGLRTNFHGLWAIADTNGKRTPVMELPMNQIP